MKLKQLLEQLNQLAKERPEALEMKVQIETDKIEEVLLIHKIETGHIINPIDGVIESVIINVC